MIYNILMIAYSRRDIKHSGVVSAGALSQYRITRRVSQSPHSTNIPLASHIALAGHSPALVRSSEIARSG